MGRQRPATVFLPAPPRAVTLESLWELRSTTKHPNVSKNIGNRSAGGTANSRNCSKIHQCDRPYYVLSRTKKDSSER
eukprot:COSAG02_NODE_414_length_22826_cov_9.001364_7_plen_77_part_00